MTKAIVGVIGGSGVYHLPGLTDLREEAVSTPWGDPSDSLRFGRVGATEAVFLARHGRGHRFSPSTINYRANIDALKRVGVTDIIALSACGSFHRELYPGVFVMIDQFVDRTYLRQSTFFGTGCVAHVSMAHPIAPLLRRRLLAAAEAEGIPCRDGGTYVCIEGPQFSSLRRIARLPVARRRRHRHDRRDRGEARARGGNLLRDRRHGDRLRLLARGARCGRRRSGDKGRWATTPTRRARWSPERSENFPPSTNPVRSGRTVRSNTPSSPTLKAAIRNWSRSSTRSRDASSAPNEPLAPSRGLILNGRCPSLARSLPTAGDR